MFVGFKVNKMKQNIRYIYMTDFINWLGKCGINSCTKVAHKRILYSCNLAKQLILVLIEIYIYIERDLGSLYQVILKKRERERYHLGFQKERERENG